MANQKISALTAMTGANVDQTADVLPIVDTSATTTKKILISELAQALSVLSTEQATTSGTSITFSSIPAWVKKITISLIGVSTNGTSPLLLQVGDSGGIETTGYTSRASNIGAATSSTSGFLLNQSISASTDTQHGMIVLCLENASSFTWSQMGILNLTGSSANVQFSAGSKATSAALDRVSLTTVNGSDTFDAGAMNILYE